jgi:HPt (histidine-containing phosphotransfer) domain-containing protein
VAAAVRTEHTVNARTPIAVITASRDAALDRAAEALGLECVLQKPVDRGALVQLLLALETGDWPASEPRRTNEVASRLAELRAALGETEVANLVRQVEPSVREALARARRAMAAGDDEAATREIHRMAGLLAHFGLEHEATAARQAERTLLHEGERGRSAAENALSEMVEAVDWEAWALEPQ